MDALSPHRRRCPTCARNTAPRRSETPAAATASALASPSKTCEILYSICDIHSRNTRGLHCEGVVISNKHSMALAFAEERRGARPEKALGTCSGGHGGGPCVLARPCG